MLNFFINSCEPSENSEQVQLVSYKTNLFIGYCLVFLTPLSRYYLLNNYYYYYYYALY